MLKSSVFTRKSYSVFQDNFYYNCAGNRNYRNTLMAIQELHILSADKLNEIHFNTDGVFVIKGRGFLPGNNETLGRINVWIDEYLKEPKENTLVIFAFEYLNSFTTVSIINILKKLTTLITRNKKLKIQWYHEEADHDIIERGEHISSVINFPFEYIMTKNIRRSN